MKIPAYSKSHILQIWELAVCMPCFLKNIRNNRSYRMLRDDMMACGKPDTIFDAARYVAAGAILDGLFLYFHRPFCFLHNSFFLSLLIQYRVNHATATSHGSHKPRAALCHKTRLHRHRPTRVVSDS